MRKLVDCVCVDVIVGTTTAAIRRFVQARDLDAELPVAEPDPTERLKKVIAVPTELKKDSSQTAGAELLEGEL